MPPLICAAPKTLNDELFGGILLPVLELLPHLHARQIYPAWNVPSILYGRSPDYTVIPGLIDLSYATPTTQRRVDMAWLRDRHAAVLGSDWQALHRLWQAYFSIPRRYLERLQPLGNLSQTLGVHYSGNTISVGWNGHPITPVDFLRVVQDFLRTRPQLRQLFVATDDQNFLDFVKQYCRLPVVSLPVGVDYFSQRTDEARWQEAELAIVKVVALSQCGAVLNTSSALTAFSKVLNPDLDIYRCGASRMEADAPTFPIAYVPVHTSNDPQMQALIDRMMQGDWTQSRESEPFKSAFFFRTRRIGTRQRLQHAQQTLRAWWRRLQPA
jgi:hypothetical protein